jgi:ribosomal protein S18 acetylase RimI-like enzyme
VDPPHVVPAEIVTYTIELGSPAQAGRLREIERAAGARFRDIGMQEITEGEPTPATILEERAKHGQLFTARRNDGAIAGFLIWSPKDGLAYIEEISVDPAHAGHKLAARMIDRLCEDVRARFARVSLATFRDVPWNAPYYAKLGFTEMRQSPGPDHDETWRRQAEHLDMSRRLFMVRNA